MTRFINQDWLQNHLTQPVRGTFQHKIHSPLITCRSGAQFSTQASETHYCSPKENVGPYFSVEMFGLKLSPDNQALLSDLNSAGSDIYGYVPVDVVVEMINREGGLKA